MLALFLLEDTFAISRLAPADPVPPWSTAGAIWSITRTPDELSIICLEALVPAGIHGEGGWRALRVAGPLAFHLTGILASLALPLAEANVPIFALSTFDTDYLLVPGLHVDRALATLTAAGHRVSRGESDADPG